MNGQALRVWLVDDDASICWILERALRKDGMTPRAFEAVGPALDALCSDEPDVLITDIRMPGQSGLELLRRVRATRPDLPVIVMTGYSNLGNAVSACMRLSVLAPGNEIRMEDLPAQIVTAYAEDQRPWNGAL